MPWTKSFLGYRNKFTMGIYLLTPTCLKHSYQRVALVALIHRWAIDKMLYDCRIWFLCWLIEKLLCNFIQQEKKILFQKKKKLLLFIYLIDLIASLCPFLCRLLLKGNHVLFLCLRPLMEGSLYWMALNICILLEVRIMFPFFHSTNLVFWKTKHNLIEFLA